MRMRRINLAALAVLCVLISGGVDSCNRRNDNNGGGDGDCLTGADDQFTAYFNSPDLLDVLANDTNGNRNRPTIVSVQSPTDLGGTAVISGSQILYTPPSTAPDPDSQGPLDFVKRISTGYDESSNLRLEEDEPDTDYEIVGGPVNVIGDNPTAARGPFPFPLAPDSASATSTWVFLQGEHQPGTYVFQTQVNVVGFDPETVEITGLRVAADDLIESIAVNNVLLASPLSGSAFTTIGDLGLGFFRSGTNTVQFLVRNTSDSFVPIGLRVDGIVVGNRLLAGGGESVTDTFTYTIDDLCGDTVTRTVTVRVSPRPGPAVTRFPASLGLINSSPHEITVLMDGEELDVVQPFGSMLPRDIPVGAGGTIRVKPNTAISPPIPTISKSLTMREDRQYILIYTENGDRFPRLEVSEQ